MLKLKVMLVMAVFVMVSAVAFADTVFSDNFSTDMIGANWFRDVSADPLWIGKYGISDLNSASISGGNAWFITNAFLANEGDIDSLTNGHAYLYSKTFNGTGDINFSGQLTAGAGLNNNFTAEHEVYIYNGTNSNQFFRVSYSTWGNTLRFEDSGNVVGSVQGAGLDIATGNWTDFSLKFNGTGWEYDENGVQKGSFLTNTMAGANSFYVKIGSWDNSAESNWSSFDNINVNAINATTAVPEPVSTTLFLLGGAVMAVKRLRKK